MIKTVLFDVDGVLLSEEHYFDASALTVWEMLISRNYLGLSPERFKTDYSEVEIADIRKLVFQHDQNLEFLKSRGLNANWDMTYLAYAHQLIFLLSQIKDSESERIEKWLSQEISREALQEMGEVLSRYDVTLDFGRFIEDFQRSTEINEELLSYLNFLAGEKLGKKTSIFTGKDALWYECYHVSQEWYVGDEHVLASTGIPSVQVNKQGFLAKETTLGPAKEVGELFKFLTKQGIAVGIGTGRPELETIQPFRHLGWLKYLDVNHIVTADDVLKAEKEVQEGTSLSKPNPFTYVWAWLGKNHSVAECMEMKLPLEHGSEILIVGDSLADLFAARNAGCQFAAVLTGLSGKAARGDFEKNGAETILDNVLGVKTLVESFN